MKRQIFKPTVLDALRVFLKPLFFIVVTVALISFGLARADAENRRESLRALKEGLLRASVKCYAMEGRYPESLSYIEENYGIYIDGERYAVYYDAFASNILPDITVVETERGR